MKTTFKSYFVPILKIALTIAVYAFVAAKIVAFEQWHFLSVLTPIDFLPLALILLLIPVNWYFEAMLWQQIIKPVHPINTIFALKNVLGATIPALITPGRIGEWPGRALFFDGEIRQRVAAAAAYASIIKTLAITLCGLASITVLIFFSHPEIELRMANLILWATVSGFFMLLFVLFSKRLFSLVTTSIPALKRYTPTPRSANSRITGVLLAMARLLIISVQYLLLLHLVSPDALGHTELLLIPVYFMACTYMPVITIAEPAMRGAAAYLVFLAGNITPESAALAGVVLWILNNIPAILSGSYYWLKKDRKME